MHNKWAYNTKPNEYTSSCETQYCTVLVLFSSTDTVLYMRPPQPQPQTDDIGSWHAVLVVILNILQNGLSDIATSRYVINEFKK